MQPFFTGMVSVYLSSFSSLSMTILSLFFVANPKSFSMLQYVRHHDYWTREICTFPAYLPAGRPSKMVRISWLWHYIHYLSIWTIFEAHIVPLNPLLWGQRLDSKSQTSCLINFLYWNDFTDWYKKKIIQGKGKVK